MSRRRAAVLAVAWTLWMGWAPEAAGQDPERGSEVYVAKCLACHGASGKGDGPATRALPRKPRDMTQASFWVGMTDERLQAIIETGRPGSPMRGFPMREEQMVDLLAYLRTFEPR